MPLSLNPPRVVSTGQTRTLALCQRRPEITLAKPGSERWVFLESKEVQLGRHP